MSTATDPEISAPMTGMKAPMKTSTPSGTASGTPSSAAPRPMPTASVKATTMVARTNAVSVTQPCRMASSKGTWAGFGSSRTRNAQIWSPWARKK
ncbi:hypothetical protein GCM10025868_13940 [Angustibacter aerolatus]|uniref:Uncharacterized protein n=1 Tax=Angustibacter aerolatus TaxID=1162965 RepID=A0ABQ6JEB1_9ACTN|nr:hypothetical protein GCM10025868_13940 [Angustibacter aerolatus]